MNLTTRHTALLTAGAAGALAFLTLFAAAPAQTTPAPSTRPAAPAPSKSGAEAFDIDPVHSRALFRIHHVGAGQFWGRFDDVTGTMTVNDGKPDGVMFNVIIKVASIDTGIDKLNGHLKTPDFFNEKEFPTLSFKSTSVKAGPKSGWLDVTGDLMIHGVTKSVTVPVEYTGTGGGGPAGRRAGYEAVFTIKRSEWKMTYGVDNGMLGDDVRLTVALEGTAAGTATK